MKTAACKRIILAMVDTHCRIGNIKYKDSNLIELRPSPRGDEIKRTMRKNYESIVKDVDIAGIAIVAWGFDGRWSRASHIHRDSVIGQTLMPSFVAEILRRDTMRDVLEDMIVWHE